MFAGLFPGVFPGLSAHLAAGAGVEVLPGGLQLTTSTFAPALL